MKRMMKTFTFLFAFNLSVSFIGVMAAQLKVDFQDSIRPVTHCASGSLYGMTETLPSDISSLVAPLKPYMFCQPPEGSSRNQHAFGDGFVVAKRLQGTTAKVQITFPDLLPYWPYQWPGQKSWLESVENYLHKKVDGGYNNIDSYVIWNEPDGTWKNENGELTTTVWKPTYDLIRRIDPNTKIVGPCIAYYQHNWMKDFLTYCKNNNCLPDLICWHQWGSAGFVSAVEDVKKLMKELGISDRPFCINEYCAGSDANTQKYEGCPGYSVPFISKFERNNVESATISWWFTGLPGRLGSLLTANNEKGGGWWLYKWYGEMDGYMAMVTPPNDNSDGLDGFAAVDQKRKCASVVLGGNFTGNADVVMKLPNFLIGKVNVKVERVTWIDKDSPVSSTDLVSETTMTTEGSSLTVSVRVESNLYAYRIYLTPVNVPQTPFKGVAISLPGKVEAENYDEAGQNFSYYDKDEENKGDASYRDDFVDIVKAGDGYALGYTEKDEWLEYTVNVEESGDYDITAFVSNGGEVDGFQLYLDEKKITDNYLIPKTCDDWGTYEEFSIATAHIEMGQHLLKLLFVGSYVNVDWMMFKPFDSTELKIYRDEDFLLLKDAQFYDLNGNQVRTSDMQKNRVYIATMSNKREGIKFIRK